MTDAEVILGFLANPPAALPRRVVAALWQVIPAKARRAQRDALLRRAARMLGGGLWARAEALAELARPPRRWREPDEPLPEPDLSTPEGCIVAALMIAPGRWGRLSARQIHRAITDNETATCQRDRLHD